jgi:hypothetical protein
LLHRLALTLALSQRARGFEKTHLKIGIRYSFSKPIAFCLLCSSLVLEASMWITGPTLLQCELGDCTRGGAGREKNPFSRKSAVASIDFIAAKFANLMVFEFFLMTAEVAEKRE